METKKENTISEKDLSSMSLEKLKGHLAAIKEKKIPVFRKNPEGNIVPIPAEKLEQFLGENPRDTLLFIHKDWEDRISQKDVHQNNTNNEHGQPFPEKPMERIKKFGNTFEQVKNFKNLSIVEREEVLDQSIEKLHILQNTSNFDLKLVITMVEILANTFYANYANLEDNLSSTNVRYNLHGVYIKSEWIVQLIIELFQNGSFSHKDYSLINTIDTGSETINKMCRVFLWFIGFMLYINEYIDKGLVTKNLRGIFKERYLRYYNKRLPDANITIETVIKGGLRRIDTEMELPLYAIGSILYDIGKIPQITYHDGDETYDENMVKVHVLTGYNMIHKAKKYPFTVLAMAALHHDYYGGKKSYSFTKPILTKITNKNWDDKKFRYFITHDEEEFKQGTALAYFPCKAIEILDIYDALVGKKKMSHLDVFTTMKKNFIAQSLQIDAILFEIFIEFIQSCGLISEREREKVDAIIY